VRLVVWCGKGGDRGVHDCPDELLETSAEPTRVALARHRELRGWRIGMVSDDIRSDDVMEKLFARLSICPERMPG
jgi:hypothetical protein